MERGLWRSRISASFFFVCSSAFASDIRNLFRSLSWRVWDYFSYRKALFARSAYDRLFLLICCMLLSLFLSYYFFSCSLILCSSYSLFNFPSVSFFSSSYCLFLLNLRSSLNFLFSSSSFCINSLCSSSVRLRLSGNYGFTTFCSCFSYNFPVVNSSTYLVTGA